MTLLEPTPLHLTRQIGVGANSQCFGTEGHLIVNYRYVDGIKLFTKAADLSRIVD